MVEFFVYLYEIDSLEYELFFLLFFIYIYFFKFSKRINYNFMVLFIELYFILWNF